MTLTSVFVVFLVCHLTGDMLLQTDSQALHKVRGLGDRLGRRALFAHVSTYTLAFLPALVWIALDQGVARAVIVGFVIAVPHLLIDDGRAVPAWLRHVKGANAPAPTLMLAVDQSLHTVCLFAAAAVAVL